MSITRSNVLISSSILAIGMCIAPTSQASVGSVFISGPSGSSSTFGLALSGDGSTVVGTSNDRMFRWTAAGGSQFLTHLGNPVMGNAEAVSFNGTVVAGTMYTAGFPKVIRWSAGSYVAAELPISQSQGARISDDGTRVAGTSLATPPGGNGQGLPYLWQTGLGATALTVPANAARARTMGISGDGNFVISETVVLGTGRKSARWSQATGVQELDTPFSGSTPLGVSGDGSVIVGVADNSLSGSTRQAYRWTAASGFAFLPSTPAASSFASTVVVSADGSIVIGSLNANPLSPGMFIWDEINGTRELNQVVAAAGINLGTERLAMAMGISADGHTILCQTVSQKSVLITIPSVPNAIAFAIAIPWWGRRGRRD